MKKDVSKGITKASSAQEEPQQEAVKNKPTKDNKENAVKPSIRFGWWTVHFSPDDPWFYRIVLVVLLLGATVAIVYFGKK